MEENTILDFWKRKHLITNKQDLKKYAREFYTEDFINNLNKWKENLKDINESMKMQLAVYYKATDQYFEDMSFNYFCENIINMIEETIEKNNDILPKDINDISEKLINKYFEQQIPKIEEKMYSVSNILQSIKKVIYF